MNLAVGQLCLSSFSLGVLAISHPCDVSAKDDLPPTSAVIERMQQRANQIAQSAWRSNYTYEKSSLFEELDEAGKSTKTNLMIYRVTPIQGVPFSRLVKIGNRELTGEEIKAQDKKEQDFRRKLAQKNPTTPEKDDDSALNPELLGRYDFKVERREWVGSRRVLILSFQPKRPHTAEKTLPDKVLNRLAGQLSVDEEEAELVQVRVHLTEDLSLGLFGMIGSLSKCDVKIERQRLSEDVWVSKTFDILLAGRKLFSSMRYHSLEETYNFKKP